MDPKAYRQTHKIYLSVEKVPRLIAQTSALEMTQLSNFLSPIICFDRTIIGDQNKLSVIKAFDNCVISKVDV